MQSPGILGYQKHYTPKTKVIINQKDPKIGNLWIGNFEAAQDVEFLKKNNISFVVSSMEKALLHQVISLYKEYEIEQCICEASDLPSYDISKSFVKATNFIENSMKKGNVLVHCFAGVSRSSTQTIVWMMNKRRKRWVDCLEIIRLNRKICNPNHGFKKKLTDYEATLGIS